MRWGIVAGGVVLVAAAAIGLRIASNRGASTGVDVALSHLPPGYEATHGTIAFNPVTGTAHMSDLVVTHNGVPMLTAGKMDITGIGSLAGGVPTHVGHITLHDAAYPPLLRHIDRVEADDIAVAAIRGIIEPAAYPGGKPASADRHALIGSLEAFGILLHVDPTSPHAAPVDITLVHAVLNGLAARQLGAPPPPNALNQPAVVADLLRGIAIHDETAAGIVLAIPGNGTFHIDNGIVQGYDGGKIESETLTNMSFLSDKPAGEVRLGTVGLTGIDATRLLDKLPELSTDPGHAGQILPSLLRANGFSLRDMKIDFGKGPLVTLGSVDATTSYTGDDSSNGTLTLRNFNVVTAGRDIPQQAAQSLQNFGMTDFSLDMDSESSFDRATGHIVAKREDLAFKGLGTLHLTCDIDRLHLDVPAPQSDPTAVIRNARLMHADLRWDDASLAGRVFKLAELRTGQSEEALRASIALPLATLVAFFPDQPDIADQINAFLDGRHTLEITLAPTTPVTLADVTAAGIAEKAHLLGVRIKGN